MSAPRRDLRHHDVHLGVLDLLLPRVAHHGVHGALVRLGDRLGLARRLDLAGNHVIHPLLECLLGQLESLGEEVALVRVERIRADGGVLILQANVLNKAGELHRVHPSKGNLAVAGLLVRNLAHDLHASLGLLLEETDDDRCAELDVHVCVLLGELLEDREADSLDEFSIDG